MEACGLVRVNSARRRHERHCCNGRREASSSSLPATHLEATLAHCDFFEWDRGNIGSELSSNYQELAAPSSRPIANVYQECLPTTMN